MNDFSGSFDPAALSEIAQFAGFPVYLSEEVQGAMHSGGGLLVQAVRDNMHWQNPSGALEGSMGVLTETPYELMIGSDLPYARRRDQGFSGMTDSLGRYFAHDPGAFYMEAGFTQERSAVLSLIDAGVARALQRLGGQ